MAYKFNPFTGTFDEVSAGGGSTNPGGSDTQVQFNDGDSFGADSGLTFNKTTNALTVGASTVDGGSAKIYGDIDLDDGGSFSTTVQAVTPTANRTISFPDATGTVALVSGANGTIQYNDAGTLKGNSDFTVDPDWDNPTTTFTALKVNVPDVLQGAADSSLLDLQAGGTSKFMVDKNGQATFLTAIFSGGGVEKANNFFFGAGNDVRLYRDAAQSLAQRNGTNAQTYRLYNTYTDASNFERTSLTRDSSGLVIDAQKGGTGADPTNLLDLKLGGSDRFTFRADGISFFKNDIYWQNLSASTNYGRLDLFGITLTSTTSIRWGNTNNVTGMDVGLARDSAGVVKVTDASTGTGYLRLIPTTVNGLTPAGTVGAGTRAFVTDSDSTLSAHHGQTVNGGGTNFVPVFSDGTNWIVG